MHGTGSRVGKPPTHVTASYSLKAGDTYAASLSHLRVWRHRADGGDILCTEGNATAITFFVASSNFADDDNNNTRISSSSASASSQHHQTTHDTANSGGNDRYHSLTRLLPPKPEFQSTPQLRYCRYLPQLHILVSINSTTHLPSTP
ncbi:hypothetical protein PPL_09904 [Heterostelium album PN500]|uniref:Uncharacterized protein n=1 Tax=Heterostelium pallidum (strain ATCC 26659 / Pp 5 / PN500) TaxID=670386 RepID=D3BPD9_HETP5|nr:hypothetical protein PPL_09904 [Heterostelium album PN500]EFA77149.1 hypothetical protein PPL_09904 [Heterostelium album PN500]|eukprot:XP_020429278.1 hypothetical protein PPL_09904 [Heterostelium album PN500]